MLPLGAIIIWQSFFFWLFALITCAFAVGVLVASNVVRMALYLIVSLAAASGLMFIAGAEFVGAMQIMIYVGGTLVLLVFGVMLTAQDAFVSLKTKGGEWITRRRLARRRPAAARRSADLQRRACRGRAGPALGTSQ